MNIRVTGVCLLLLAATACSDDSKSGSPSTQPIATLTPGTTDNSGNTVPTQSTFMPDCTQMPSAAELNAVLGVTLDQGQVIGSGTCEFLGLNDQSKYIVLSLFSDPGDQAAFIDLQTSLGASAPLNDPALTDAQVGPTSVVYISTNNAIYTVQAMVTDGSASDQVTLSAAVLKAWLAL